VLRADREILSPLNRARAYPIQLPYIRYTVWLTIHDISLIDMMGTILGEEG